MTPIKCLQNYLYQNFLWNLAKGFKVCYQMGIQLNLRFTQLTITLLLQYFQLLINGMEPNPHLPAPLYLSYVNQTVAC